MNEETTAALEAMKWLEDMEGLEGLEWMEWLEAMAMAGPDIGNAVMIASAVNGVINLVFFLLMSWGIYMLAKKMDLKRAWMSWVPLLQYYPMAQAWGKDVLTHFVYPFLGMIASFFAMWLFAMWGEIGWIIGWIVVFIAVIYMLVKFVQVLSGISKNTGRWGWTTAWLFFLSFIMFPVVWYKYKKWDVKVEETVSEKVEDIKEEL